MKAIFAVIALSVSASAQLPEKPKPPVISDSVKVKFFKAQAEFQLAQANSQKADAITQEKGNVLQKAVEELNSTCGKGFHPGLDKEGMPECQYTEAAPVTPTQPANK